MNIRRQFLRAVRPVSRLLNRINMRVGSPLLHGDLYHRALDVIEPGDILLTWTAWRPTNWFIPGKWSHAVMVVDGDILVEATLPCVRTLWLVDVWASASKVKIIRPNFLSKEQRAASAVTALSYVGTPYDLDFDNTPRELYCSELIVDAMRSAGETPKFEREVLGAVSITPDSLDDPRYFTTLIESSAP